MSSIYVTEPPTKGKVVIETSMGPLDIELWPKEAPKAVRNFVQLCLEGYYHNTSFHRIIKSFLVQGGDPTATGTGSESIYGAPFADEFHSRLRFNHRGLVACANAGTAHSNGSQFFISLDRCDWLDRKNTIFGKVTGDSIFNLLRIGDAETDENDRPIDPPPRIISVEVLWNPFDDIIPRQLYETALSNSTNDVKGYNERKKAVKKLNLLSFGDEVEEEQKDFAAVKEKIKSSHDVLNDPRLLKEQPVDKESSEAKRTSDLQVLVREALSSKKNDSKEESEAVHRGSYDLDDDEASFDAQMRLQVLRKRKVMGDTRGLKLAGEKDNPKEHGDLSPRDNADELEGKNPKMEKLTLKKKGIGSEARAGQMAKGDVDLQLLGHAEQERQRQKQRKRRLQGRADDTLARLEKFRSSLFSTKSSDAPGGESRGSGGNEDDNSGWKSHQLKFLPDPSKKDGKDDPDAYMVVDPLLEKGKEKFNRMQAKAKRREREWAGKSIT